MKTATRRLQIFSFAILLAIASGCAGTSQQNPQPDPDSGAGSDSGGKPDPSIKLAAVGSQVVTLAKGQQVQLRVRYTEDEAPITGETITWSFRGVPLGSSLSAPNAVTDLAGEATVIVTAGTSQVGFFQVEALGPFNEQVLYNVEIRDGTVTNNTVMSGSYNVTAVYNISNGFQGGTIASILNVLEDITDDPDDPYKFIVDQLVDNLSEDFNFLIPVINGLRPTIYASLASLIDEVGFVNDILSIVDQLATVFHEFEIRSKLFTQTPQNLSAAISMKHKADSLKWVINGTPAEYTFSQLGQTAPEADVTLLHANNTMSISQHQWQWNMGAMAIVVLNQVIINNLDPNSNSISDLILNNWVDCLAVGQSIHDTVEGTLGGATPSVNFFKGACEVGVGALAGFLESAIVDALSSSAVVLDQSGICNVSDTNSDNIIDTLSNGTLVGQLTLDTATANIHPNATFSGAKP